jgi:HEAT repeat protein
MHLVLVLLMLLVLVGCKAAPPPAGTLTEEQEEFLFEVDKRMKEYDEARSSTLTGDQIDARHRMERIADERREMLEAGLQADDFRYRMIAIAALGFSKKDEVLGTLVRFLEDPDPVVREHTLWGIAVHASDRTPVEPILPFLKSDRPESRGFALYALTKILRRTADRGAMPAVLECLKDPDHRVRAQALLVLSVVQRTDTIAAVVEIGLKDEIGGVRWAAVAALTGIGGVDAVDPIIGALADPEPMVSEIALKSLRGMTGQDFGKDPAKWAGWWTKRRELGLGLEH